MINKKVMPLLLFACSAFAGGEAFLENKNDNMNIAAGALVTLTGSYYFDNSEHPVLYPILTTAAIGLTKEIFDKTSGHDGGFSSRDLKSGAFGIGLGVAISNGFVFLYNPQSRIAQLTFSKPF